MKKIASLLLLTTVFLLNIALAYTTTIRAKGIGVEVSSGTGNVITATPTDSEITGWAVTPDTLEVVNNQFTMPDYNVQLDAIIRTYTLTVNPGGTTYTGSNNATKEVTAPTQTGYTVTYNYNGSGDANTTATSNKVFSSWALSGGGSISSTTTNPTTYTYGTSNGTLTASYTNESVTLPTPTREGYTFNGWYTASSGGTKVGDGGASYTPTADVTLYAHWTSLPVPTLATNNGSWYTQGGTTVEKSSITSIALLDSYTPGTVVESWDASKNSEGTITAYLEDDGSENSTYKLTLVGNGSGSIKADTSCNRAFYEFSNITQITSLNILDTSNVTTMTDMFGGCRGLISIDVSGFNTINVNSMYQMFSRCSSLTNIDVSGLDTSNVTTMTSMFNGCSSLTSVDVSGFNTSKVTYMSGMFANCSGLTSINVSGFNTSKVTDMSTMFTNCSELISIDVSGFNTNNVTNMSRMFESCSGLTSIDASGFNTSNVTNMSSMFNGCSGLTSINISGLATSNVTSMRSMFTNCSGLTNIDVSGFNTSNVTDMAGMFNGCSSLTSVDVSGFNTSKVTDMSSMFANCSGLTSINVSGFNTSSVIGMRSMFNGCSSLTSIDVSGFNTNNVTNMSAMFYGCRGLTNIALNGVDTSNVTGMSYMFYGCSNLTSVDVSGFNTSNVTDMSYMFNGCSKLTSIDVSGFDTSSVTEMSSMLYGMTKLQEIKIGTNFSFTGNGSTSCTLPTPSSIYITGADGNWYNTDGTAFAPANVPSNVADTYYASSSLVPIIINSPVLGEGLTPVNWNGSTWVTTDEENWDYNYEIATAGHNTVAGDGTGKWANAQTSDGSLYVWIPRYTYKITSGEHQDVDSWSSVATPGTGKIEVKFSNGTTDDTTDSYISHPAFTFGEDELEGIWVAKYEASRNDATSSSAGSGTTASSKPGVVAWNDISVSMMYDYAYNLNRALDSHLMRNSEWGAVAYLTNAIGKIPYINNSSSYITGNAGGSQDASSANGVTNAWNTANGVKASSTHNVYGIYDLSGCGYEYVSAYYTRGSNVCLSADTTDKDYAGSLYTNGNTKYVETYNPTYDSSKKGDAVYETSSSYSGTTSWDGDDSDNPITAYPVFIRGGSSSDTSSAGVFYFSYNSGIKVASCGFRPVLSIK